jgi:hypothetical protein
MARTERNRAAKAWKRFCGRGGPAVYEGGHGEARGRGAGSARRGSGGTDAARIGSGGGGAAGGGAGGAGVAAGGVVAVRAKRCLTHFMKDLSLYACAVGRLPLHLQEVLERFEVRL